MVRDAVRTDAFDGRGARPEPGLVLLIAIWIAGVAPAFGQDTGRVVGRIVDRETEAPLIAAQIRLESSDIGTFTRDDGTYFIEAVPTGTWTLTTEYLGYENGTRKLQVPPGGSVRVDFALTSSMIDSPALMVVVERPRWDPPEVLESVVEVFALPADLPRLPPETACVVEIIKRSAHIEDGRWQMPHEVGRLQCSTMPVPCESAVSTARLSRPEGSGR